MIPTLPRCKIVKRRTLILDHLPETKPIIFVMLMNFLLRRGLLFLDRTGLGEVAQLLLNRHDVVLR